MMFLSPSYMLNHGVMLVHCHLLEAPAGSSTSCNTDSTKSVHLFWFDPPKRGVKPFGSPETIQRATFAERKFRHLQPHRAPARG
jgi:hypothetical protein